ncbi:nitroreductase/quinone reductase family protein [Halostreptopolyspora alba]|uniref:DUF385 domain-containing protein n=1 Tax=Halostreptopolyspora alba TaxID=2487137 RepID=A0A3N0EGK2_9ACTN|nr:DUF385 domain-containing protein [Nocardiopsaceae bacterium YIM 96095]
MYKGGRPNPLARVLNRVSAVLFSAGRLVPDGWVTLEVPGRRSGRTVSFPLVAVGHDGQRYLVSMLGEDTNWVRNVRAAGMRAVLRHRDSRHVRLEEVDRTTTAPILRRYIAAAPGARPHIPVDRRAPLEEFERIAPRYPVFRIVPGENNR